MVTRRFGCEALGARVPWRQATLIQARAFSDTTFLRSASHATEPTAVNPRWLSETKARIGKCITFGMSPKLVDEAGKTLQEISRDWRDLVAGSEGFLTDKKRAGLHRQPIVWGEQDTMGHVNNVMYVRYAESGRTNWTRNIGQFFDVTHQRQWNEMLTSKSVGLILKSITVDYKFPMTWPDRISVYHKLRQRPDESTTSLILDVLIMSEAKQRPAAKCLEDVVVYDYRKGKKSPLAPFMLEHFREMYDLQQTAKKENTARVQSIDARVKNLEEQSWDRPDAKEDLGSAV